MTLNFLDKAIAWFSPKWGAARAEYRSYYDIARQDRFGAGWNPPHNATPEMTDAPSRSLVRAHTHSVDIATHAHDETTGDPESATITATTGEMILPE